jgi:ABC-2 type transport system permease protein
MSAVAAPDLPPKIAGPSALGGDLRRFIFLSVTLAVTDFKLRFFGSLLGYLWQLFRPLLLFGVLYVVFTEFVRIGEPVPHYPVVLLANIVLFQYFAEASGAVTSIVDRENLIRKIQFPRLAVVVANVLTATFNMLLNMIVVLSLAVASGVSVRLSWLELPVLLACLAVLSSGIAMLLSALYVKYRDVKPIWEVFLQVFFYGTPVIYAIETIQLSEPLKHAVMSNPLAAILQQTRHAVIDAGAPGAATAVGSWWGLLIPVGITAVVLLAGCVVFKRAAPDLAERL